MKVAATARRSPSEEEGGGGLAARGWQRSSRTVLPEDLPCVCARARAHACVRLYYAPDGALVIRLSCESPEKVGGRARVGV